MSKKQKRIIYNICLVLLLCVFFGCAIYLFRYYWASKKSEDKVDELKQLILTDDEGMEDAQLATDGEAKPEFVEIDGVKVQKKFEQLYRKNSDFIGWLTIDKMVIDYPVMQTMQEEEYYLRKDFDKNYSLAGTLFVDTSSDVEKPSDSILIYGHNMKTGKMFHTLLDYEDEDFYREHKYIQFDTIYGDGTYEVIAAFRSQIYGEDETAFKYYQFFDAENEQQFLDYVNNCKRLTNYDIPVTAEYGDKLLTLSTCAYHVENGRFVVVAKKIEE